MEAEGLSLISLLSTFIHKHFICEFFHDILAPRHNGCKISYSSHSTAVIASDMHSTHIYFGARCGCEDSVMVLPLQERSNIFSPETTLIFPSGAVTVRNLEHSIY